jgi:hypothetical protein
MGQGAVERRVYVGIRFSREEQSRILESIRVKSTDGFGDSNAESCPRGQGFIPSSDDLITRG